MKRRILITTLVLLIFPTSLLLADTVIRYVDIEKGQNRIEELGVENTALKNKIESLTQRFFELKQSVTGWNETLYEIRPIIERLRRKKNSLYVILEKIADENLKAKATATYDRSSDLLNRLRTTKEETDDSVLKLPVEVDQYIAANDQIHLSKHTIGHQVMIRKCNVCLQRGIHNDRVIISSIIISE